MPHQNTTSSKATSQNAVNDPIAPNDQAPSLAMAPHGSSVLAWQGSERNNMYVQQFDPIEPEKLPPQQLVWVRANGKLPASRL